MALQYGAYIAMAGIGLYAIFVGEIISIFNFMLEPSGQALLDDFIKPPVEPTAKILQFISIGVAPGLVMSATSFLIARRFGSKQIGWLIIAGGLVLLIGMFYANTMIDGIEKDRFIEFSLNDTSNYKISINNHQTNTNKSNHHCYKCRTS